MLFKDESGQEADAQLTAFEDTWHWNHKAEETYHALVTQGDEPISRTIEAMRAFIGSNQMMAARLIEREKAAMGVFIMLEQPSRPMLTEAAAAGFYHSPGWGKEYRRIQIVTIQEMLDSAAVQMPPTSSTFKQAAKADGDDDSQLGLFK